MTENDKENKLAKYEHFGFPLSREMSYAPQFVRRLDRLMREFGAFPDFMDMGEWPSLIDHSYRLAVTDWKTEDKQYLGTVELPGMKKEEIKLHAMEGGLEILAEQYDKKEEQGTFSETRRRFRTYERLPEDADLEHIEASYDNGILKLNIPRLETSKSNTSTEIKIN